MRKGMYFIQQCMHACNEFTSSAVRNEEVKLILLSTLIGGLETRGGGGGR